MHARKKPPLQKQSSAGKGFRNAGWILGTRS
jgi:hypothetical protein